LAQSVKHPNIIEYLDAFIAENQLYIAFEWAEAGDLKRQIRKANEKNVRFDERTVWRYFSQICSALLYLHEMRIMHRDLKPANIFLTLQGVVKLGDLGLGRHLSEDTMEAHSKVGTPLYMSPEVLRGEGYDWKSDVWSLGCILYELAMLRSPFKSEGLNLYGLFQKINGGQYEPLPVVYTAHLRDLVVKMISLSPENRPTMQEVWEATQARPPSATFRKRQEIVPPSSSVALSNSIPSITQENIPGMRSGSSGKSDELSKTKMPLSNSPAVSLAPSSVSSGGSRGLEPPMVTRIKKVLSHGNQRPISPPDDNNQDTSPCIEAERPSTAPELVRQYIRHNIFL
jgi:serine/threonine protein kinase